MAKEAVSQVSLAPIATSVLLVVSALPLFIHVPAELNIVVTAVLTVCEPPTVPR